VKRHINNLKKHENNKAKQVIKEKKEGKKVMRIIDYAHMLVATCEDKWTDRETGR
jgi:hypothetical protein